MKKIPNNCFLYWGNKKLSFLRYLTIYTFAKFNPGWNIYLYLPTQLYTGKNVWVSKEQRDSYAGRDYSELLESVPNLKVIRIDMETLGFSNKIPEVFKADIVRNYLIHAYGGIFIDTDILFTKPLDFPDVDVILCRNKVHYSIGLIGGTKKNIVFKRLFRASKTAFDFDDYQVYGTKLWGRIGFPAKYKYYNLPMDLLYSVKPFCIPDIYEESYRVDLPKEAIGIHWYGGHPLSTEWENRITPSNYNYNNLLCRTIKEVYDGGQE